MHGGVSVDSKKRCCSGSASLAAGSLSAGELQLRSFIRGFGGMFFVFVLLLPHDGMV